MNPTKQQNLFGDALLPPDPSPWELAADADQMAAQVVFNRPLETTFSYLVPDALRSMIEPGQRVKAPFGQGNRLTVGYCVGVGPPPNTRRALKSLDSILDREPLLTPHMLELTRWIADRYLCGWGQVLESVVPAGVKRKAGTKLVTFFRVNPDVCSRLADFDVSSKQRTVLELLCASVAPIPAHELAQSADCGPGPIDALRKKGLIVAGRQRTESFAADFGPIDSVPDLELNRDQQEALAVIRKELEAGRHRTVLLHGVTGSGKTEVYIQAIREVVSYGRQAIVLVPEISLTPQTIRRFRSRFQSVAVLHSHLKDTERHWHWQQIARGAVQVVVGARSAVFAPTPHLGLIVIDEEHETSFKQESVPRYHTREVARKRAELENIPLILGSATPTLESWLRVKEKKDVLLSLPERVEKLPLPPVVIVDVRNDPQIAKGEAIGRALQSSMRTALEAGGQVILFLNLRGYSPALWCRACGRSVRCPHCDVSLTWHKDRKVALCHFCEYNMVPPKQCPNCAHPGIRQVGTGTQRLEQEVRTKFAHYKCLRMDSDSMRKRGSHDEALEAFRKGEVHILLGTQMIAKGLDFPNVTLVGVVSADTLLHQPDLRAAERTFQLLAQVSGRTGRSTRGGRVFVQSACPADPAICKASEHDYLGFVEQELKHRSQMLVPPFYQMARVILRGPNEEAVKELAKQFADLLRQQADAVSSPVSILGPAPAPLAKLKDNYRYHFRLAATEFEPIQQLWRRVAHQLPQGHDVEYVIDVDPLDMR